MSKTTKIDWCDATVNTIGGCTRVSEGCLNCYACRLAATRLAHLPLYKGVARVNWQDVAIGLKSLPEWTGKINFDISPLLDTLTWRKPKRIFVCSMSDWMHPQVKQEWIDEMLEIFEAGSQHIYMTLTKRPKRFAEVFRLNCLRPKNLWIGVTAENQKAFDERARQLAKTPAALRFISFEPLLEPIFPFGISLDPSAFMELTGTQFDWAIIGCETGSGRRPCKLEWIYSLVSQCKSAGVPCWIKTLNIDGKIIHDINQFPEDLRLRQFPKPEVK